MLKRLYIALVVLILFNVIWSHDDCKYLPCDNTWFTFDASKYHVLSGSRSFDVAETRCERMGASLFVANSMEEYEFVRSRLFSLNSSSEHFIGMAILGGDCEPKWQMPHGLPIDTLPWGNNSNSRHLRRFGYYPVALMTPSSGNLRFVKAEDWHTSHTAVCERNASYVGYSAEELEVIFFNTSESRHIMSRTARFGTGESMTVKSLAQHFMHWLFDIYDSDSRFDWDDIRIVDTMRRMNPEIYELSKVDLSVSDRVYMMDWFYNYYMLNGSDKPKFAFGCEDPWI